MNKYLIQLRKNSDWDLCEYIKYNTLYYFPTTTELSFLICKRGDTCRYGIQHFFEFNSEKFCRHMQEEDQDIYTIFAHCCNRNHEAMIIPCFENNINLPKYIGYDTIKSFIRSIIISVDHFGWKCIFTSKYNINHTHPLILQVFESFWEELQIVWIP